MRLFGGEKHRDARSLAVAAAVAAAAVAAAAAVSAAVSITATYVADIADRLVIIIDR